MDRDFAIDGTGNVIRPGDRVVVHQRFIAGDHGPGVLAKVLDENFATVLLDGMPEPALISVAQLRREDDGECVDGQPLWYWR